MSGLSSTRTINIKKSQLYFQICAVKTLEKLVLDERTRHHGGVPPG
jgi:hypothetical protein